MSWKAFIIVIIIITIMIIIIVNADTRMSHFCPGATGCSWQWRHLQGNAAYQKKCGSVLQPDAFQHHHHWCSYGSCHNRSVCPLSICQLSSHSSVCHAMLHSFCCCVLCCAVMCCDVMCCAVLCCVALCSKMVSHAVSWMLAKPGCMHKDVYCIIHKYSVCSKSAWPKLIGAMWALYIFRV